MSLSRFWLRKSSSWTRCASRSSSFLFWLSFISSRRSWWCWSISATCSWCCFSISALNLAWCVLSSTVRACCSSCWRACCARACMFSRSCCASSWRSSSFSFCRCWCMCSCSASSRFCCSSMSSNSLSLARMSRMKRSCASLASSLPSFPLDFFSCFCLASFSFCSAFFLSEYSLIATFWSPSSSFCCCIRSSVSCFSSCSASSWCCSFSCFCSSGWSFCCSFSRRPKRLRTRSWPIATVCFSWSSCCWCCCWSSVCSWRCFEKRWFDSSSSSLASLVRRHSRSYIMSLRSSSTLCSFSRSFSSTFERIFFFFAALIDSFCSLLRTFWASACDFAWILAWSFSTRLRFFTSVSCCFTMPRCSFCCDLSRLSCSSFC
mmetsp:Transcript_10374/g.42176  ORF Transcript_10374/g.42176 Transcript_10374/m.42176 type:complete len:376 (-) Transcript_10374:2246-3373(-)